MVDSGLPRARSRRRLYLAALVAAAAVPALQGGACVVASGQTRAFDLATLCAATPAGTGTVPSATACPVTGDAQKTSGLTGDTVGFLLGNGGGSVRIPLDTIAPPAGTGIDQSVEVQALVATDGAFSGRVTVEFCGTACQVATPLALTDAYQWLPVASGTGTTGSAFPPGSVVVLTGAGIDVADIRAVYQDYIAPSGGCSSNNNLGIDLGITVSGTSGTGLAGAGNGGAAGTGNGGAAGTGNGGAAGTGNGGAAGTGHGGAAGTGGHAGAGGASGHAGAGGGGAGGADGGVAGAGGNDGGGH